MKYELDEIKDNDKAEKILEKKHQRISYHFCLASLWRPAFVVILIRTLRMICHRGIVWIILCLKISTIGLLKTYYLVACDKLHLKANLKMLKTLHVVFLSARKPGTPEHCINLSGLLQGNVSGNVSRPQLAKAAGGGRETTT